MYDHQASRDVHTVEGAHEALRLLFPADFPGSVLDVGCGTGTWLEAARMRGATEVAGVDGVRIPADQLLIAQDGFHVADLNRPFSLDRRFELVLCLETAEHLEPQSAAVLVATLASHGDRILFSAATPGQPGTNHVNCQWPDYWQDLFNRHGFACTDSVRWLIWDNGAIEPWYRQNLMLAVRDAAGAGTESRIRPVIHPAMLGLYAAEFVEREGKAIAEGSKPWRWYVTAPLKAARAKLSRKLASRA